jgi:hypothetical protein
VSLGYRRRLTSQSLLVVGAVMVAACGGSGGDSGSVCQSGVLVSAYQGLSAFLFKDGQQQTLALPSISATDQFNRVWTTGVFAKCADVYVSGYYKEGRVYTAGYWKNGVWTVLNTESYSDTTAMGVFVSGTDVYVTGRAYDQSSRLGRAVYWKNGGIVWLPSNAHGDTGEGVDIVVSGNDVYVADASVGYFRNSERIDLPLPANTYQRSATAITLSASDVYVAGYAMLVGGRYAAFYWKNGSRTDIGDGSYLTVSDIEVAGGNVYVAGSYWGTSGETGCYWKNGQRIDVPSLSIVKAIAVRGSDIHLLGPFSLTGTPMYLLNGQERVLVPDPTVKLSGLYVQQ